MATVSVPLRASELDTSFAYNKNEPTRYTEYLSFVVTKILSDLSSNGFKFIIDNGVESTAENPNEVISDWSVAWGEWLKDVSNGVGNYLAEKEGSRAAFLVPAAPLLPSLPSLLPVIGVGLAIKVVTDIVSNVAESYANFQQVTRSNRLERVLDESLNEETYFGLGADKSYLKSIKEQLEKLNEKLEFEENGEAQSLSEITKKALTQIFLEVVVDRQNTLESVTFEGIKAQQEDSGTA